MSYLLKALQKAEEERKQGQEQNGSVVMQADSATLPKWLMVCLFVFLAVSTLKILGFMDTEQAAELEFVSEVVSELAVALEKEKKIKVIAVPQVKSLNEIKLPAEIESNNTEFAPLELAQLSALMLKKIPTLMLESHIYSSAAEYRSVVINGQSYSEGMLLSVGVLLDEITSDGIVIKVGQQYVSLPKGISWVAAQ